MSELHDKKIVQLSVTLGGRVDVHLRPIDDAFGGRYFIIPNHPHYLEILGLLKWAAFTGTPISAWMADDDGQRIESLAATTSRTPGLP